MIDEMQYLQQFDATKNKLIQKVGNLKSFGHYKHLKKNPNKQSKTHSKKKLQRYKDQSQKSNKQQDSYEQQLKKYKTIGKKNKKVNIQNNQQKRQAQLDQNHEKEDAQQKKEVQPNSKSLLNKESNNGDLKYQTVYINSKFIFNCLTCPKRFDNQRKMKKHLANCVLSEAKDYILIYQQGKRIYTCKTCKKKLKNGKEMKIHCSKKKCNVNQVEEFDDRQSKQIQKSLNLANAQFNQLIDKPSEQLVQKLEKRIQALEAHQKNIRIQDLSEYGISQIVKKQTFQMSKSFAEIIQSISKPRIFRALMSAQQNGMDITKARQNISHHFLRQIEQLNFDSNYDEFSKNLNIHWKAMQQQMKGKDPSTISRYRKGFSFWSRYNDRNIKWMSSVIDDLRKLNNYDLRCAIDFFNNMKRESPHLFKLPDLPQLIIKKTKILKRQYQSIDIESVKSLVYSLIDEQQYELATDLWVSTTMGLRKRQLLRVSFKDEDDQLADSISIVQFKNNHPCIRVVPHSLKCLLIKFGVSYPMSMFRLKRVRKLAIQKFHRFYGLRSLYITLIISSVLQKSTFHKNISTTINYYLDEKNINVINKIFHLEHNQLNTHTIISGVKVQFQIDVKGKVKKVYLQAKTLPISVQRPQHIQEQKKDAVLLKEEEWKQVEDENDRNQIVQRGTIFRQFQEQLEQNKYDSLSEAIHSKIYDNQKMNDEDQDQDKDFLKYSAGQYLSDAIVLKNLKAIYGIQPLLVTCKKQGIQYDRTAYSESSENKMLIVKNEEDRQKPFYQVSDNQPKIQINQQMKQRCQRLKKIINYGQNQYIFTTKQPYCPNCSNSFDWKACQTYNHYLLACTNQQCNYISTHKQYCFRNYSPQIRRIFFQNIDLQPRNVQSQIRSYFGKNANKKQYKMNNCSEILKITGRKYIHQYYYTQYLSEQIFVKLPIASDSLSRIIQQNKQFQTYLPLHVQDSEIGYIVKASKDIQKGVLICCFLGVVTTIQSVLMQNNDSIFKLGWIKTGGIKKQDRYYTQLVIDSSRYANISRFFSTSTSGRGANCKAEICLHNKSINNRKEQFEICVYFTTKRHIYPGDELCFYYGEIYLNSEQMKDVVFIDRSKSTKKVSTSKSNRTNI